MQAKSSGDLSLSLSVKNSAASMDVPVIDDEMDDNCCLVADERNYVLQTKSPKHQVPQLGGDLNGCDGPNMLEPVQKGCQDFDSDDE